MSDRAETTGEIAVLGLGSNLGDRAAALRRAVASLAHTLGIKVLAVSKFIETDPVGVIDQPRFLNGAVKAHTTLGPRELLERCLAIELDHGRDRSALAQRGGARTLDIDLLLFGERVIDEPGLRVPHPHFHERLFALVPAAEIAGDMRHPICKMMLDELARACSGRSA